MTINEAQTIVEKHIKKIGYDKIETLPSHAFIHLMEEIGEVARIILYQETKRSEMKNNSKPHDIEDEVADVLWQTLKLASYLKIDLEKAFENKYQKNLLKNK